MSIRNISRRSLLMTATAGATAALLTACGGDDDDSPHRNLVETAQADPQFSILVEALTAAKLTGTLSAAGPFTVFAPTNNAFAALLTELGITKAALLADTALLTAVLTYHVLAGKVEAAAVATQLGAAITTLQGGVFKIERGSGLTITDGRNRQSTITATDLQTTNGVIHVVDNGAAAFQQDHRRNRAVHQRLQHPGGSRGRGRLGTHPERPRPLHGVRADQCRVCRRPDGAGHQQGATAGQPPTG